MSRTRVALAVLAIGALLGVGLLTDGSRDDSINPASEPQSPRAVSPAGRSNYDTAFKAAGGDDRLAVSSAPAAQGTGGATPDRSLNTAAGAGPRVVKTASLQLAVRASRFDGATQRVTTIASTAGGFVSASERRGDGDDLQARFTVRVPAERFDAVRGQLTSLGQVRGEATGGRDVTAELVDYEARLRSMRAEEEALRAILGRANTVGETLEVTRALAEVRGRIEQLDAQRAQLADSADLATIELTLATRAAALAPEDPKPLLVKSLEDAAGAALNIVGGAVVVVGALLPVAAIGVAVLLAVRAARRRRVVDPAVAS